MELLQNLGTYLDLEPWGQQQCQLYSRGIPLPIFDELTFLKIVNLVNIVISSHTTKQQALNGFLTHGQIVDGSHLKSQEYLDKINLWSKKSRETKHFSSDADSSTDTKKILLIRRIKKCAAILHHL